MYCLKCGKKIPDNSLYCMFCGATITNSEEKIPLTTVQPAQSAHAQPEPLKRYCAVCGRPLPDTSISDVCVTCLYNRNFVAQQPSDKSEIGKEEEKKIFESAHSAIINEPEPKPVQRKFHIEIPEEPDVPSYEDVSYLPDSEFGDAVQEDEWNTNDLRGHIHAFFARGRKLKIAVLGFILVFILSGVFLLFSTLITEFTAGYTPRGSSSSAGSTSSEPLVERALFLAAQKMVQEKAYSPDSVHFDTRTLEITEESTDVFQVTQQFERLAPSGETKTSIYTAILQKDSTQEDGYKPLMLQVDGETLYDYR